MKRLVRPIRVIGSPWRSPSLPGAGRRPAVQADQIGTLTFNNLTAQDSAFTVTTSGGCPDGATNFLVKLGGGNIAAPTSAPTSREHLRWHDRRRHQFRPVHRGVEHDGRTRARQRRHARGCHLPRDLICRTALRTRALGEFAGPMVLSSGGTIVPPRCPSWPSTRPRRSALPATNAGWGAPVAIRPR